MFESHFFQDDTKQFIARLKGGHVNDQGKELNRSYFVGLIRKKRDKQIKHIIAQKSESESTPADPPRGPTGPPLSSGEKDALRLAVASCWNTGSLSTEALRTTVIVAVSMTEDAKPMANTIRLVSSSGGGAAAARSAFDAARRAIIRCGVRGYGLPVEKYDQWRDIEMTFNPEKMRIK